MEGSDETGVMQRIQYQNMNGQMQNLSVNVVDGSVRVKRPAGIPPAGPHSQFMGPKMGSHMVGVGGSHTNTNTHLRSLSFDHLPPLSRSMVRDSGSNDVAMEERGGSLQVPGVPMVHVNEGRPPRRGHRRSSSDIPMGLHSMFQPSPPQFGQDKPAHLVLKRKTDWGGGGGGDEGDKNEGEVDDLFSAYMNLENLEGGLNSSSLEDKDMDSRASGTRTNDSSENEVESSIAERRRERGKRSATGDINPSSRHFRSFSMDSFMGNLNFSDELPKLPPSPGIRSAQHSPSSSLDGNTSNFSLEFGNGEFNAVEMKKIMASEKLAEIAMADPKRAKRILANRQSAARSKERKLRYIAELEHKVQTLQTEATTLSAQLTLLQRDSAGLTNQNNELRFRLQAMEQQAQLRDALNDALTAEVQRLKVASAEIRGEAPSSCMPQQLMANSQMLQMQTSQYLYQLQQQQRGNHKEQPLPQRQTELPQQSEATKSQQDIDAAKS